MALISYAITAQLICVSVYAYAKIMMDWFLMTRLNSYEHQQQIILIGNGQMFSFNIHQISPVSFLLNTKQRLMNCLMGKSDFCICKNKDADQLRSNCTTDKRLCFPYTIVQSLYFLNPKFQASSHLHFVSFCFIFAYRPSKQFFSHVETEPLLPGYYQYFWEVNVSCSRTQHGDLSEDRTPNLSLWSPMLYH